jgi:hypothetical protein
MEEIHLNFSEHATTGALLECGVLSDFIIGLIQGSYNSKSFLLSIRQRRGSSLAIISGASAALHRRKKLNWALRFSTRSLEMIDEKRHENEGRDENAPLVVRAIVQHAANLAALRYWKQLDQFMADWNEPAWSQYLRPYALQAALQLHDAERIVELVDEMARRSGMTMGLTGSIVSAMNSCLSRSQVGEIHEKWGGDMLNGAYAEKYKVALSRHGLGGLF